MSAEFSKEELSPSFKKYGDMELTPGEALVMGYAEGKDAMSAEIDRLTASHEATLDKVREALREAVMTIPEDLVTSREIVSEALALIQKRGE